MSSRHRPLPAHSASSPCAPFSSVPYVRLLLGGENQRLNKFEKKKTLIKFNLLVFNEKKEAQKGEGPGPRAGLDPSWGRVGGLWIALGQQSHCEPGRQLPTPPHAELCQLSRVQETAELCGTQRPPSPAARDLCL